jgi:hypothetical protein
VNGVAVLQCLGWAIDHPVLRREAGRHFDGITKVPADLDRLELRLVVVADNRHL